MQNIPLGNIYNLIQEAFKTHCKLKVAEITAINGKYADVKFFDDTTDPLQNIPLIQGKASYNAKAGVLIPYSIGDNVIVGILDELNKDAFFEKNNIFQKVLTHNLGNAIILGHADTRQQDTEDFDGVLIYKGDTRIEITDAGIKIVKGGVDIKTILTELITAIQSITVTDPQSGAQLPINNAGAFANIQDKVNQLFT